MVTDSTEAGPAFDERVYRRIHPYRGEKIDLAGWLATVPAVAQILRQGLDLRAGVTVLVGENGSGKSTVAEVIAEACGLNPQGGSAKASYRTRDSEPGIGGYLWAERGLTDPAWSYFLRADTMQGLYSYLEENPDSRARRMGSAPGPLGRPGARRRVARVPPRTGQLPPPPPRPGLIRQSPASAGKCARWEG